MKKITAWIGKSESLDDPWKNTWGLHPHMLINGIPVFKDKGVQDDWDADDWPPRKVIIEVEDDD